MYKPFFAIIVLLGLGGPAQAHQIWIEQADGQNAAVRFGEFSENLREVSPGLLDKFGKVTATLISATGETTFEATKAADGFTLPFAAKAGDIIVAADANYPLYVWKQHGKDIRNWYYPAARFITGVAAQPPKLVLDLVPAGGEGQFRLVFKNEPRPKTKVTLTTPSGWSKEAHSDDQGLVSFDMPWKGVYVAEVSVNDAVAGERRGAGGPESYDAVSYATTVTYVKPQGLDPIPPGPPAKPAVPK